MQAAQVQFGQCRLFGLGAPLQAYRFAVRQGDELVCFARVDVGIGVAEDDASDVEGAAAGVLLIAAPGLVAMGIQRIQLQHGLQRCVDQAQAGGHVGGWQCQIGRLLGQGLGDARRLFRRQWGQREEMLDQCRVAADIERPGLALGQVDIPRRIDRDGQFRHRLRLQVGALQARTVNLPADAGRAGGAGVQGQRQVVAGIEAPRFGNTLQQFGAMRAAQTEGAQAGGLAAFGPDQAQDFHVLVAGELRPHGEGAVDFPPFLGTVRILALANLDAEVAAIGRPFQHVEQLLAGAGRTGLLLGDGERSAAQVFQPGQGAHAGGGLRRAFVDGTQQYGDDVLALLALLAGATAQRLHLAVLILAQADLDAVRLAGRAGNQGGNLVAVAFEFLHQIDIGPGAGDIRLAEPFGQMFFGEVFEGDESHAVRQTSWRRAASAAAR